jgi:hypothetical protein
MYVCMPLAYKTNLRLFNKPSIFFQEGPGNEVISDNYCITISEKFNAESGW